MSFNMPKVDAIFQQLTNHQEALTTIQAVQARHSSMLETQHANIIDIKALLQDLRKSVTELSKSVTELSQKLDNPPPPTLVLPPTPTSDLKAMSLGLVEPADPKAPQIQSTVAGYTSSAPSPPKFPTPPPASDIVAVAAPPSPKSPPLPPLPPANSSPLPQYPLFVPIQNSVHYQSEAYYLAAALHKALSATLPLNSNCHIKQKWNAQDMFAEMHSLQLECSDASGLFAEMSKWKYESNRLVFDPGGIIKFERLFAPTYDLEDKVNFKAWVMIRILLPKRLTCQEILD